MLYASIIFEMANNLGKFPHIAILIIITIFTLVSGNINLVDQEVTWILNLQRPSGTVSGVLKSLYIYVHCNLENGQLKEFYT